MSQNNVLYLPVIKIERSGTLSDARRELYLSRARSWFAPEQLQRLFEEHLRDTEEGRKRQLAEGKNDLPYD